MKHVYNDSANFTESYVVNFHINEPSNLTEIVAVIGIEGMVSRTRFLYTRDYLMPGMCSVIKSTAMEKLLSFPGHIRAVMS